MFIFYPFRIIKAIFNRLNLRLSQKITHLDTFLDNFCSKKLKEIPLIREASKSVKPKIVYPVYVVVIFEVINSLSPHFSHG